jgi:hypothetical protein
MDVKFIIVIFATTDIITYLRTQRHNNILMQHMMCVKSYLENRSLIIFKRKAESNI